MAACASIPNSAGYSGDMRQKVRTGQEIERFHDVPGRSIRGGQWALERQRQRGRWTTQREVECSYCEHVRSPRSAACDCVGTRVVAPANQRPFRKPPPTISRRHFPAPRRRLPPNRETRVRRRSTERWPRRAYRCPPSPALSLQHRSDASHLALAAAYLPSASAATIDLDSWFDKKSSPDSNRASCRIAARSGAAIRAERT